MREMSYERSAVPAARPATPVRRRRPVRAWTAAVVTLGVVVTWGLTRPPSGLVASGPTAAVVLRGATMPVTGELLTTVEGHDVFAAIPSDAPLRFEPFDLQPEPRPVDPDGRAIDALLERSVTGPVVALPTTRQTPALVFTVPSFETNTFLDDITSRVFDRSVMCIAAGSASICNPSETEPPYLLTLQIDPATLVVAWIGVPAESAVITLTDGDGHRESHRPIGSSVMAEVSFSTGLVELELAALDGEGRLLTSGSVVAGRDERIGAPG